jgi:hypothetical protein
MSETNRRDEKVIDRAFQRIQEIVLDGLRHGYFNVSLSGEMEKGKKRKLVIASGKSYLFHISEDELSS